MEDIGFFTQLSNEILNINLSNFIFIALVFYIAFYFSKKAKTLFFHLLYSSFGLYILFKIEMTTIIYNVDLLVALGLLIPQIKFIVKLIIDIFQTIKMMTANTYYFFVTIYYKILRFINWVKSTYIMLKTFFTSFSFKRDDYKQDSQSSYQEYRYEQKYEKFYEENEKEQEAPKAEPKKEYGEFERFYNSSAYVVLGVSADDDYKSIKKVYHKLLRVYHPDLNPDNIELFTEITQNINNAWEKVEEWKK